MQKPFEEIDALLVAELGRGPATQLEQTLAARQGLDWNRVPVINRPMGFPNADPHGPQVRALWDSLWDELWTRAPALFELPRQAVGNCGSQPGFFAAYLRALKQGAGIELDFSQDEWEWIDKGMALFRQWTDSPALDEPLREVLQSDLTPALAGINELWALAGSSLANVPALKAHILYTQYGLDVQRQANPAELEVAQLVLHERAHAYLSIAGQRDGPVSPLAKVVDEGAARVLADAAVYWMYFARPVDETTHAAGWAHTSFGWEQGAKLLTAVSPSGTVAQGVRKVFETAVEAHRLNDDVAVALLLNQRANQTRSAQLWLEFLWPDEWVV
ncbi:MAG: hypothetical protein WBQ41_04480 [Solirubrobacterales bacterium]